MPYGKHKKPGAARRLMRSKRGYLPDRSGHHPMDEPDTGTPREYMKWLLRCKRFGRV